MTITRHVQAVQQRRKDVETARRSGPALSLAQVSLVTSFDVCGAKRMADNKLSRLKLAVCPHVFHTRVRVCVCMRIYACMCTCPCALCDTHRSRHGSHERHGFDSPRPVLREVSRPCARSVDTQLTRVLPPALHRQYPTTCMTGCWELLREDTSPWSSIRRTTLTGSRKVQCALSFVRS